MARRILDAKPRRVLDLACGPAPVVRVDSAPLVVCADLVFEMLVNIRANRAGPVACLDARRLPFRDHSFDFVWCGLLIDHIREPEGGFRSFLACSHPVPHWVWPVGIGPSCRPSVTRKTAACVTPRRRGRTLGRELSHLGSHARSARTEVPADGNGVVPHRTGRVCAANRLGESQPKPRPGVRDQGSGVSTQTARGKRSRSQNKAAARKHKRGPPSRSSSGHCEGANATAAIPRYPGRHSRGRRESRREAGRGNRPSLRRLPQHVQPGDCHAFGSQYP